MKATGYGREFTIKLNFKYKINLKRMFQDENHHLLIEQKQIQTKFIKFSEEILSLRQENQEVEFN